MVLLIKQLYINHLYVRMYYGPHPNTKQTIEYKLFHTRQSCIIMTNDKKNVILSEFAYTFFSFFL